MRRELFTGGNKTTKEKKVEKCPSPLVFSEQQLMLLAVSKKRSGPKTHLLVVLSLHMQSAFWVSHCVKKEHIQMHMTIKC